MPKNTVSSVSPAISTPVSTIKKAVEGAVSNAGKLGIATVAYVFSNLPGAHGLHASPSPSANPWDTKDSQDRLSAGVVSAVFGVMVFAAFVLVSYLTHKKLRAEQAQSLPPNPLASAQIERARPQVVIPVIAPTTALELTQVPSEEPAERIGTITKSFDEHRKNVDGPVMEAVGTVLRSVASVTIETAQFLSEDEGHLVESEIDNISVASIKSEASTNSLAAAFEKMPTLDTVETLAIAPIDEEEPFTPSYKAVVNDAVSQSSRPRPKVNTANLPKDVASAYAYFLNRTSLS